MADILPDSEIAVILPDGGRATAADQNAQLIEAASSALGGSSLRNRWRATVVNMRSGPGTNYGCG